MAHAKFVVPTNLTLRQSLNLLFSIVESQFKNCQEKIKTAGNDTSLLRALPKALSEVLWYLEEGLAQVENYYKLRDVFSLKNPEVLEVVNELRILDHDIKRSRDAVEKQITSEGSGKPMSTSGSNSHFSLSSLLKKTKISARKEDIRRTKEKREAQEVEELKKLKIQEEERLLMEKNAQDRMLEKEQARMLEQAVKRQVEREIASRATREPKEPIQKEKKAHMGTFEKPKGNFERSSLEVRRSPRRSADQMRRRSLDGGARSKSSSGTAHSRQGSETNLAHAGSVSKAANLAWSQMNPPTEKPEYRTRKPVLLADSGLPYASKPKYEYVQPTIKRPSIKIPGKTTILKKHTPEEKLDKSKPQDRGNRVRSPKSPMSPPSRSFSPGLRSPRSVTPEVELSPQEKKIKHVMQTLEGVDEDACQHILNDILVLGEKVYWDDIVGLNNAKNSLKETVVYPFLRPDLFKGLREPVSGMLLFGPPGTGKSMIAKAVATESQSTFFSISASSLLSKYLGESEKLVRALFYLAKRLSPSIIFVDEIDSLLTSRSDNENESSRRIKTEVLIQWSSLSSATAREREEGHLESGRVLVLAATNLPWAIDEAARRRFTRRLHIPLPEYETRIAHLKKLLLHHKNLLTERDFEIIGTLTDGYSGSDITALAKDAAMEPIRELGDKLIDVDFGKIRGINLQDFQNALLTVKKSVSPESLSKFEEWAANFGSQGS
ncbi:LANO_0E08900g1_1 [Lachancea nothofagi CBS 11611]|uniref:LANO_0E08900g1_1 n=1 Tax=Lachancea nothofagi CBS 11611 TaxID=1266666 RepID=A0A1G4JVD7_9SACH|nr:LANO_0E08900g1_1 [Lachancea nothofagi CBS 11611]